MEEHKHIHDLTDNKKGYTVLAAIVIAILAVSFGYEFYNAPVEPMEVMRIFMGLFFLVFGTFKVISLKEFAETYSGYDLLAKKVSIYGYVYPFIELALGAAFLLSYQLVTTNSITATLMFFGALGVLKELGKKNRIPCACLGALVKLPLTTVSLIEDLGMGIMALISLTYLI